MFRVLSALFLTSAALSGCQDSSEHERFRGLMVIGPHGPEFNPSTDFSGDRLEIYPWRMEAREPEFGGGIETAERRSEELGLPRFSWIKVEFAGNEVPVSPNHHGASRQVRVEKWISIDPCQTQARECLGQ